MKKFFSFKLLALCSVALAFVACSDDLSNGGSSNDVTGTSALQTASYLVGGGDQARVVNTGYWGVSSRSTSAYDYGFPEEMNKLQTPLTIPDGAVELKDDWSHDQNASVYYIPEGKTVSVQVPNNFGGKLYVAGTYTPQYFGNNSNGLTLYVLPGGVFEYTDGININGGTIYNQGSVTLPGFDGVKIGKIYNTGTLVVGSEKTNLDFQAGVSIYSKGGDVQMIGGYNQYWHDETSTQIDFKGTFICDGTLTLIGRTHFQNIENTKDICSIISDGELIVDATVCAGSIKCKTIKFDGDIVKLHPEGLIKADEVNMPNSGCQVLAYNESSKGLVDCKKLSIHMINDPLSVAIGQGVYLQVEEIYDQASGITYTDFSDLEVASQDHINKGVKVTPSCSADADVDPEPEPKTPSLDLVSSTESPTHDHDADKTDAHRRHLSATSLTFDGEGNIYASYHMRGGNWAHDTYDKDDIEGCIERWTFDGNEVKIGNWMWTNEFDFNHIILDGNKVVTVGHKGGEKTITGNNGQEYTDFGGIIGRMPTGVWEKNWDATDVLTREDFEYKYLTTEKPLYGDYENEKSGNVTYQKIDYQSAGDGNCVVKVDGNYYVATSAGYGVVDENFMRIKDENGDVLFTSTDGSSKYLVVNDETVNVLYLNERAEGGSEATTEFGATLATLTTTSYPNEATTQEMSANVNPVDGKNVIAVNDGVVYACLSNGGLQIGKEVKTFKDELGVRSVNGVAVDDKYIYVANGSYITVLDKETKDLVVERKGDTKYVSANFVEVKEYNGEKYVFVAFGQDGIKVFKLNIPTE